MATTWEPVLIPRRLVSSSTNWAKDSEEAPAYLVREDAVKDMDGISTQFAHIARCGLTAGAPSPKSTISDRGSKYPHLTFKWENLLYSCHKCNDKKDDKFPEENGGYVSPSDPDCNGYFDFDFDSCRIRPKNSIDDDGLKLRIEKLICDLKLNRLELTNLRRDIKAEMNKKIRANPGTGLGRLLGRFTSESSQCSSFAKAYKECQSPRTMYQ